MPPKRKAANDNDQDDETVASSGRGRSRGRGRGRGGGAATRAPPKKKTNPKDFLMIIIDAGDQSYHPTADGKSSLEKSKEIADWIISRKIFADSDTCINVGVHPAPPNLEPGDEYYEKTQFFYNDFEKPRIDCLKRILDITQRTDFSNVLEALEGAVQMLEESPSVSCEDNIAIAVLSNCFGVSRSRLRFNAVIERLKSYNVTLAFIGEDSNPDSKSDVSYILDEFKNEYPVTFEPFENALNMVSFFAPKPKAIRGQPFQLQLSESFKIDLQLFVKISEEKFIPKFDQVTDTNEPVSKIRQYEQVVDESNIDEEGNSESKAVTVGKGDVIKGYHYGTSIIPFSKADKELAGVEKEGKQLQLVMFTKEENILPHYLMSSCRWLIPNKKSESSSRATKALVEALKKQGKVAIVRYAYNAVSNPRLAVLFPKITKNGCPVFEHFILPFNEDFRGFEFPSLEKAPDPSDYQNDTVESYIDHFMLTNQIKNEEGEKEKVERMKIKEVRNPQPQQVCMSLRKQALGLPPELDEHEHKALLSTVSTPRDLTNSSEKIMKVLAKSFDLKIVERPKEAGIFNKPLSALKRDFEDMKPPASYDDMDLDMFDY